MPSSFNSRKAAQVVAYFATRSPRCEINVVKVVKLVYLADRESLGRHGFPVLDDNHVSMKHGPVNSETYRHINGEVQLDRSGWTDFLSDKADHKVAATEQFSDDDLDELSEADLDCLKAVWERFGAMGPWDLRDWTHDKRNVPEWEDPNGSSYPIPLERIMTFLGIENAEDQAEIIRSHRQADELFASLRG